MDQPEVRELTGSNFSFWTFLIFILSDSKTLFCKGFYIEQIFYHLIIDFQHRYLNLVIIFRIRTFQWFILSTITWWIMTTWSNLQSRTKSFRFSSGIDLIKKFFTCDWNDALVFTINRNDDRRSRDVILSRVGRVFNFQNVILTKCLWSSIWPQHIENLF